MIKLILVLLFTVSALAQQNGWEDIPPSNGSGTVTSVGLSLPASVFSVTGSPVTSSGILSGSFINQSPNTVFAGPASGGSATPAFRSLVLADIPSLSSLYANVNLSNLVSPTSINQNLLPSADASKSIGSASLVWIQGFFENISAGPYPLSLDGAGIVANNNLIHNVLDPVSVQDAATKNYVDTSIATATTKAPNTVAGFDASGVLESIPAWNISTTTGGISQGINYTPTDTGGTTIDFINALNTNITPTANLVNLQLQALLNQSTLNGPFDIENYYGLNNIINTTGTGSKDGLFNLIQTLSLGDGTNAGTSNGATMINNSLNVNSGMTLSGGVNVMSSTVSINAGSSAQYVSGLSTNVTLNEAITGNVQMQNDTINVNINQPPGVGINGHNTGGNIAGTVQFFNGDTVGMQVQSGGTVTNGFQPFYENSQIRSGGTLAGGYTGIGSYAQLDAGAIISGGAVTSFNANPTIAADLSASGYNGLDIGGQFSSPMQYLTAIGVFSNLNSGSSVVNTLDAFNDGVNLQSGSSINFYTGLGIFTNVHSGAAITGEYQGINVNPNIPITTPQISLAKLNVQGMGTGSTPNLTGLDINLSGINSSSQKKGINVNDGNIQVNANYDTAILPASPGFVNINTIGGLYHVASGNPVINTLVLANNIGVNTEFEDDFGPDSFGGFLGYVNNGLLSQLAVASGKTVDTFTSAVIGASVPSLPISGGTITNANVLTVVGPINQGGSLNITNLKGVNIPAGIFNSYSATNAWGIYDSDATVDNWFAKDVVIGGSTGKPSGSNALDVTGDSTFAGLASVSTIATPVFDDSTTTGSNAVLSTPSSFMRLSNASLVSIDNLDDAVDGKIVTITNITGASITLINNAGGTPALRINTSTTQDLIIPNKHSITLQYDAVNPRWRDIGAHNNAFIDLTTEVTGVLPIANGGTNNGSLATTAGGVLYTDGTQVVNVGPGTSGQFLISNGASAPSWSSTGANGFTSPVTFTTTFVDTSGNPLTKAVATTIDRGTWWQSGHFMNIKVELYWTGAGSGAVTDVLLEVPNAQSIDLTSTGEIAYTGLFEGAGWTSGIEPAGLGDLNGAEYKVFAQVYDATHVRLIYAENNYLGAANWNSSSPVGMSLNFKLPIVGF